MRVSQPLTTANTWPGVRPLAALLCILIATACTPSPLEEFPVEAQATENSAPPYAVDASWPRELPNNWIL